MDQGLQKLSATHEAIMDWLLLNPGATLAECGAFFNYTPQGIGYIVRSDCFRAKLAERRGDIEILVAMDIPKKLQILSDLAIEKVTKVVQETGDPDLLVDVMDKTLHRLGYAPTRGAGTAVQVNVQNNYSASRADIEQAQAVMLAAAKRQPMLIPMEVANELTGEGQEVPEGEREETALPRAVLVE